MIINHKKPIITRYRPDSFQDFMGNTALITKLRRDLKERATHTFLIIGPIGCGKTTLARIVAKELGCPKDSRGFIAKGTSDYGGIDEMREVLSKCLYAGKRTFLFDEAHSITHAAQNAALSLFEEPPGESYFILCTNQPDRIIDALRSRCFTYELSPLLPFEIQQLLKRVCLAEKRDLPQETLNAIAKDSKGVPREALKMLERAMDTPRFITEGDSNRVFILQSKADLEYFRLVTKDQNNYYSEAIDSTERESLRGQQIIIIQIKSEVGRDMTEKLLRTIGNIHKSLTVLEVPGEENESFEDWVCSQPENSSIDLLNTRLNDLVENPPELKFPSLRTSPDDLILSFEAFNHIDSPERKIIMSPWLEQGSLILLSSHPGVGKTLFTMEIAASCSDGRDAMSGLWFIETAVPVLYIDGEMHWDDLKERSKLLGLSKSLVLSKVFYENKNGYPPLNIADKKGIRDPLTAYILEREIKLLILDNIYSLVVGLDHNFERQWSPINQWLISLRNKGIAVIIVHHTGKKGDQLGTSSRKFNIDYSFMLEKKPHPKSVSGNCAFSIIVDKERRPVKDVRKKIFALHQGEWTVHDVSDVKTKHADKKRIQIAEMLINGVLNKEIAEYFKCTRANISNWTRKLREEGIIRRVQGSNGWIYELTEIGEKWYEQGMS